METDDVQMFYVAQDQVLPDGKRLHAAPVAPARATLDQAESDLEVLGGREAGFYIGGWRSRDESAAADLLRLLAASKDDKVGDPPRWGQAA